MAAVATIAGVAVIFLIVGAYAKAQAAAKDLDKVWGAFLVQHAELTA